MDVKKVLLLVGVAILAYTLLVHPSALADGVQALFGWIVDGFEAILTFLREVLSGLTEMFA